MERDPLSNEPIQRGADARPTGPGATVTRPMAATSTTVIDDDREATRNRVQWGPILAGTLTAMTTMLLLTLLGLAIGTSAFEPGTDVSDWGTAAGIWGAISALIAFFLGGWVAAKSAAVVGGFAGLMNGFLVGAATLLVILWLTTTGLTNLLGFVGNNIADVAALASDVVETDAASTGEAQDAAQSAQETAEGALSDEETFDRISDGAWGTLAVLALALAASTAGGLLGRNERLNENSPGV